MADLEGRLLGFVGGPVIHWFVLADRALREVWRLWGGRSPTRRLAPRAAAKSA